MPIYEYKALNSSGIPEYGSLTADTEAQVEERLRARGLTIETVRKRALDEHLHSDQFRLPRLIQLRIGEELRTAFLTDLPVTDALRALAAEPMQHPVRLLHLWLMMFVAGTLMILLAVQTVGLNVAYLTYGTGCVLGVLLLTHPVLKWWFEHRVRAVLIRLASAVERGQDALAMLAPSAPRDISAILTAETSPERRARATADVVPFLGHRIASRHRIALLAIMPVVLAISCGAAAWLLLYFVVPMFRSIFADFALEIPWYTQSLFWLSKIAEQIGVSGALTILMITGITIVAVYQLVIWSRVPLLLRWIPFLGSGLRNDQLARFAMTLSALIRNGCEWPAAVRAAAWGMKSDPISQQAELLAQVIDRGEPLTEYLPDLSALPITLLLPTTQSTEVDPETVNHRVAEALDAVAQLLSYSSLYEIRLLVSLFHFFLVAFSGTIIVISYFCLFGPLIELLRSFF